MHFAHYRRYTYLGKTYLNNVMRTTRHKTVNHIVVNKRSRIAEIIIQVSVSLGVSHDQRAGVSHDQRAAAVCVLKNSKGSCKR